MASQSHIFPLTISLSDFTFPAISLVAREITIHGSCASTMTQLHAMVDFAARHKIRPIIEQFPMTVDGITNAFAKLEKGQIRYRAVVKAGSA